MSKKPLLITGAILLAVIIVCLFLAGNLNSLVPAGQTVWIPDYGTVACKQTRLECSPGLCNDVNPQFKQINQDGEKIYCGAPTISDANYYEGCSLYLATSGAFDFSSYQVCSKDGACQNVVLPTTSTTFGGKTARNLHLKGGEYAFVNPNIATVSYSIVAPVYGIAIEGAVKPAYADRCNIAQLMTDKQIAVLKDSEDYAKTINAGEISPGNFPITFITGYKASYSNERVLTRNGDSWFVESVGLRCKIAQDTRNRYIVTDECVTDNAIQCYPNIGNCDKDGKIMTSNDPSQKACTPGTLIGSSTQRTAISPTQACQSRCSTSGVPENFNCVDIKPCADGQVLGSDYTCVASTKLTEKQVCESNKGKFSETKDKDGNVVNSCDYSTDNFWPYFIAIIALVFVVLIAIKLAIDKKRG